MVTISYPFRHTADDGEDELPAASVVHSATGRGFVCPAVRGLSPSVFFYDLYPTNKVTTPNVMGFHLTPANPAERIMAANSADAGKFNTDWGRY